MTHLDIVQLSVALVLAILAGLLAGVEAAVQTISKAKAEELVQEGKSGAKHIAKIAEEPAPYINSAMFMGTLCQIASVVLVTSIVSRHFGQVWSQLLVAISVMVVVSYILWGVAPHTLGRQRGVGILRRFARPLVFLDWILGPIPELMILIGNALTPGKGYIDGPFTSEAELRDLVDIAEKSELIEAGERKMIHSVFELGDTLCKEVMVPRTDIVFIEAAKTLRQGVSLALRSGFSRIPVITDSLDNIVGIFYLKDAMRRIYDLPEAEKTETVGSHMRSATYCPDSKPVDELLGEMQLDRTHLKIVVDEFGGTAGLVTIEDILEEIVGEIVDEYDSESQIFEQLADGKFRVSARMPVDDMGELFGRKLDDDDVETVGGLMAKELNMVPIPDSEITWNGITIRAEKTVGRRNQIGTCVVALAHITDQDEESNGSR